MSKSLNRHQIREKALQSLYFEEYYSDLKEKIAQRKREVEENSFFTYSEELTLENATKIYKEQLKKVNKREKGFQLFLEFGFEKDQKEATDRVHFRILEKLLERKKAEIEKLSSLDFSEELDKEFAIQSALSMRDFDSDTIDEEVATPEYLERLVSGVLEHKADIDKKIQESISKKWKIERLSKVDLTILRIAVYELLFESDEVDALVVINEAIQLAKAYSDEDSSKFINGVLDTFNKNK